MEQAHNRGWDVFDRSIDLRDHAARRKIEKQPRQAGADQDRAQRRLRVRARRRPLTAADGRAAPDHLARAHPLVRRAGRGPRRAARRGAARQHHLAPGADRPRAALPLRQPRDARVPRLERRGGGRPAGERGHRRGDLRRLPAGVRAGLGRRDRPARRLGDVSAARPPLHDRDLRSLRARGRRDRAGGGVRPRPHRAEDARARARRRDGPAASQRGAQVGDLRSRLRRAGLDRRRRPHRRVQSGGGGDVRQEPRRGARPAGQRS